MLAANWTERDRAKNFIATQNRSAVCMFTFVHWVHCVRISTEIETHVAAAATMPICPFTGYSNSMLQGQFKVSNTKKHYFHFIFTIGASLPTCNDRFISPKNVAVSSGLRYQEITLKNYSVFTWRKILYLSGEEKWKKHATPPHSLQLRAAAETWKWCVVRSLDNRQPKRKKNHLKTSWFGFHADFRFVHDDEPRNEQQQPQKTKRKLRDTMCVLN